MKTKIEKRLALQDGNHDNFVSRHQRARIFSDWIVDKFGLEKLKEGYILGELKVFFIQTRLKSPQSKLIEETTNTIRYNPNQPKEP